MDITLAQTFIAVDDHDKALAFYRDILGLEVRKDVAFGDMRWVTVGSPKQPELNIVLEPPLANPNASAEDKAAMAAKDGAAAQKADRDQSKYKTLH